MPMGSSDNLKAAGAHAITYTRVLLIVIIFVSKDPKIAPNIYVSKYTFSALRILTCIIS